MWLLLLLLLFPQPVFAEISLSASIGENEIKLTGFSSPDSKIELENYKTYDQTYSDDTGYFEFNTLLPKNPTDLCLTSTDNNKRKTIPVCIPPPPAENYDTEIGPIILPPTLSINNENINPGEIIYSSGQSIPDSEVNIYFYKVNDAAPSFPKAVQAYSLPIFKTKTNQNGHFEFNLPTAYSSDYRLFATVNYKKNPSPKSLTLTYTMPSLTNYYLIIAVSLFFITSAIFVILLLRSKIYDQQSKFRYLPAIRPETHPAIL